MGLADLSGGDATCFAAEISIAVRARSKSPGAVPEPGGTPSPMPQSPAPMLCTLVDAAFDSPDWSFEPKVDGLRVLARFDGDSLTLLSRNNKPQESRFPEVVDGLRQALRSPAIIDGE